MNKSQKDGIISGVLKSSEGRTKLAQAMMAPLRHRMNFSGIARKIFTVLCVVCNEAGEDRYFVSINLRKVPSGEYCVCSKCLKETKIRLARIRKGSPKDLPLYINDSNIFIKEYAIKKLKSVFK